MRQINNGFFNEFWFAADDSKLPEIVQQYRKRYKRISERLDSTPEIMKRIDADLRGLSQATKGRGRKPTFSVENLFRALIVKQIEGLDFRGTSIRIAESETLQMFCRLDSKDTIDFTLINKASSAFTPETWQEINRILARSCVEKEAIDIDTIRADTTVTETNIHWPTDSSLLWDTYRVIAREIRAVNEILGIPFDWRFHDKKIKKLHLNITRYSNSTNKRRKRQVEAWKKDLMLRVEEAICKAEYFTSWALGHAQASLLPSTQKLVSMLPSMQQVADVARRRTFDGEQVSNSDKVFSIFEPHTELIMRGRRGKPIEFGHKVLHSQTREKIITDYQVLEQNRSDSELADVVVSRHKDIFGNRPKVMVADQGFCADAEKMDTLEDEVETLAIPRRTRDFADEDLGLWQKWRAGIEGTISCLKRVFRLVRCSLRTFKHFASHIGSAVFSHNLVVLAKME